MEVLTDQLGHLLEVEPQLLLETLESVEFGKVGEPRGLGQDPGGGAALRHTDIVVAASRLVGLRQAVGNHKHGILWKLHVLSVEPRHELNQLSGPYYVLNKCT